MNLKTFEQRKKLVEKYGDEQVYIVPFNYTEHIKNGLKNTDKKYLKFLSAGRYILRSDAEGDMTFQQIIPYSYIVSEDEEYFITERIGGEERLKGKLSIGVGGHINPCDGYEGNLEAAMRRELNEEIIFPYDAPKFEYVGTVRDLASSTPDHLGIVYKIVVKNEDKEKVQVKEIYNLKGMWLNKEQLLNNYLKFESWAKFIIQATLDTK
jgi:predicted NUDIX family phosphoesterase